MSTIEITQRQLDQTHHYLEKFCELNHAHYQEGNHDIAEYWKGQVMGICKMCTLLELDISTGYYLGKLL